MPLTDEITADRVLAGLFASMLLLAGVVASTGSDAARTLLRMLIPISGAVFALAAVADVRSRAGDDAHGTARRVHHAAAVVLVAGCAAAVVLEVTGDGVFSNPVVDIAIIGSVLTLRGTDRILGTGSARSPTPEVDTGKFWGNRGSILPDAESVLVVALCLAVVVVLLDVAGIDVIAGVREMAESDPLLLLWLVAIPVLSKGIAVLRDRWTESTVANDD